MKNKMILPVIFISIIAIIAVVANVTTQLKKYRQAEIGFQVDQTMTAHTPVELPDVITDPEEDINHKDCSDCHTCLTPTHEDPCIPACSRFVIQRQHEKEHDILGDLKEKVIIDSLENTYMPVVFSHKSHASMGQMGEGCVLCHHYSPADELAPACKNCHDPNEDAEHIEQPGLKGAYHRQCIFCHIEWSNENDCFRCHEKKGEPAQTPREHVRFARTEPAETMVFHTAYNGKSDVLFNHSLHKDDLGFECADCHHDETCGHCHNPTAPEITEPLGEHVYAVCSACHVMSDCSKCHHLGDEKSFNHAQTGWPLGEYHVKLKCSRCHTEEGHKTAHQHDCKACHSDWNMNNFDHKIVGFELGDAHRLLGCEDCHPDRQYNKEVICETCHG